MRKDAVIGKIGYFTIFIFAVITAIILYFSTRREYLDKSEYYELARQLTPDRKHYIYKYARYGAAFTSDITGVRILDLDERFAENAGEEFFYSISGWISEDSILINSVDRVSVNADTLPISTRYEQFKSYTVKRVSYESTVKGGGGAKYTFDSLSMQQGKLKIFNIDNRSVPDLIFALGPVTVFKNGSLVEKIEVESIKKYYNSANGAMVVWDNYYFVPNREITLSQLGDVGYFLSLK